MKPTSFVKLKLALLFFIAFIPMSALSLAQTDEPQAERASPNVQPRFDEAHGKWTVTCLTRSAERVCAVRQFQTDRQTGKPVLMVELRPTMGGSAKGGIMLPNGLRREAGIRVVLDGNASGQSLPIRDCSEKGCAVTVTFSEAAFEKLRQGKLLQLLAAKADGKPQIFAIDLNGFSNATARSVQLERRQN